MEDDTDFFQDNSTNTTSYVSPEYIITLKFFVSVFCIFSIGGSLLIIFAYIFFKETRTLARQLLVNLSVADLVTALANLVGLLTNFDRFKVLHDENYDQSNWVSIYCTVQAFFAQLGTDSSILWTIAIALYLMLAIILGTPKIAAKLLPVYYIISWGIPMTVMIWFAAAGFLGFEPNTTPGWCAIKSNPSFAVAVGYTVFVYIAFLVLPCISIVITCYTKIMQKRDSYDPHVRTFSTRSIDIKLTLIPIIFVILRIWGVVVDLLTFQIGDAVLTEKFERSIVGQILIILKGVGDSSQGFANGILFVGLTPSIRKRYVQVLKRIFCISKCCRKEESIIMNETASLLNTSSGSHYSTSGDTTQSLSSSSVLTYEIYQN